MKLSRKERTGANLCGAFKRPVRMGILSAILALALAGSAAAQTTYTWAGANGGSWSKTSNWSPTAPTGGPGADGADTTDIADFGNIAEAGTSLYVNYDASASGYIGTLDLYSDNGYGAITLALSKDLTITQGGQFWQYSGSGGNAANLSLGAYNLTIGSDATFVMGVVNDPEEVYDGGHGMITTSGGEIVVDGTLEIANAGFYTPVAFAFNDGSTFEIYSSTTGAANISDNGDFTTDGDVTIESTGSYAASNKLIFGGADVNISSGTTFSGFGSANVYSQASAAVQTMELGTLLPAGFYFRPGTSGTLSNPVLEKKEISTTAVYGTGPSAVSNAVREFGFYNVYGNTTQDFVLESNMNLVVDTQAFGGLANLGSVGNGVNEVDLNGYVYDMTTATTGTAAQFTIGGNNITAGSGNAVWFLNSGASSIANDEGIFRAGSFNIDDGGTSQQWDVGVGAGVILQAVQSGQTSDLGQESGGVTTVSPQSTFYYTGTGEGYLESLVGGVAGTSGRAVGQVVVGTGTSSSVLGLKSNLTAAGDTTVNAGADLDLNGFTYTLSGSANLIGSGTIENNGAGASNLSFASGATGGFAPGGGSAGATTAKLSLGSGIAASLASTSVSTFNFATSTAFDVVAASGNTTVTVNGELVINLLNGFSATSGTQFVILTSDEGNVSGDFSDEDNVVLEGYNAADYTATFSDDSGQGIVTIDAVPEPSTGGLLGLGLLLGLGIQMFFSKGRRFLA